MDVDVAMNLYVDVRIDMDVYVDIDVMWTLT